MYSDCKCLQPIENICSVPLLVLQIWKEIFGLECTLSTLCCLSLYPFAVSQSAELEQSRRQRAARRVCVRRLCVRHIGGSAHEVRQRRTVRKCVQRKRGAQKRTTRRALFVRCGSPCMCHRTLPTMAGNVKFYPEIIRLFFHSKKVRYDTIWKCKVIVCWKW